MYRTGRTITRTVFSTALGIALLGLLATPVLAEDARGERQRVRKTFELNEAKSAALFNLLAPDHVRVIVSRPAGGVHVNGTAREVDTLAAFVKVLTRDEGTDYNADAAALAELRKRWDTEKTYKMPKPVADALFVTLAFNDVPVFVSHADKGLTVQASKADQKIINRMVQVARGNQLGGDKPKKHEARPSKPAKNKPKAKVDKQEKTAGAKERPAKRRGGQKHGAKSADAGLALAERMDKLTKRVAKLEKQLATMRDPLHGEHGDHHVHADQPRHGKPGADGKRKKQAKRQMIDRRYRLPKHHADNVFALFAPADITDVIISREGKELRIRANESDHKTIKRLVDLLKRGDSKKPPHRSKARADASPKKAVPE